MNADAKSNFNLPDKLYFRIGEVSEIADLPTHVIRFWETEFKRIAPKRTASGQRIYRKKDVELILEIKHLLHERRFTIEGARQHLKARRAGGAAPPQQPAISLQEIKIELESIRDMLR